MSRINMRPLTIPQINFNEFSKPEFCQAIRVAILKIIKQVVLGVVLDASMLFKIRQLRKRKLMHKVRVYRYLWIKTAILKVFKKI